MSTVRIKRKSDGKILLSNARWCTEFFCRLRGLTFRTKLPRDEAIVLVERSDSRVGASIHMMFVFFSISVIWINSDGEVVDRCHAKPFRPLYVPSAPARYILEGTTDLLEQFKPGDVIHFETNSH